MNRPKPALPFGAVLLLATACATGPARVSPDDARPTASMDAVGQLALCRSTFDEAKAALGIPYRDGLAHRLRVASWKITPRAQREAVPLVIAFRGDGVAVDLCYDLPGLVHCELKDQCEGMSSAR